MKNDIYNQFNTAGTNVSKGYLSSVDCRKRKIRNLILGIGLPLLSLTGYLCWPSKFSDKLTEEEKAKIEQIEEGKKLESFYSNSEFYGKSRNTGSLESMMSSSFDDAKIKDVSTLVKNGADVKLYHSIGKIQNDKVENLEENDRIYGKATKAVTINPADFRDDLERSMKKGKGTVVLLTSRREHYNILPDGTVDPDCSYSIMKSFLNEHPEYSSKFKAVFLYQLSQESLLGQPDQEAEKLKNISDMGWLNSYAGVMLGKDDLSKPRIGEKLTFWPSGEGIKNFSSEDIQLEKSMMDSRFEEILGEDYRKYVSPVYSAAWGTLPEDKDAIAEISKNYEMVVFGKDRCDSRLNKGLCAEVARK